MDEPASGAAQAEAVDDDVVTADDVVALNRASVERSAAISRLIGSGLVVVGAVVALAWLWTAVRLQQKIGDERFRSEDTGLDRLDLFAANLGPLALAALALGFGAALRLTADYTQTRVGGSTTGFVVGDRFDEN